MRYDNNALIILRLFIMKMFVGRIQLSATLENDGNLSQILFSGNESAKEWTEVLVSVCSLDDLIPQTIFWKVKHLKHSVVS
jgi:hypothetical protein